MTSKRPATIIAFDYGRRRIGIAAGDTVTGTAAPRPAAQVMIHGPDWARIAAEIRSLRPDRLVVGAPYNADGSPGELMSAARAFAAELELRFGLGVDLVDERFSSLEAGASLKAHRAAGARSRRVRKDDIDSAAAAVILERWLSGER